ncbi:MAG: S1C family serine protease [Pirellulaceae bacterium]|nr:serine protease [Planctomycetaceae bacterium]MDP6557739.1 S1C family serine protease [Pirellulaceae bacterium]
MVRSCSVTRGKRLGAFATCWLACAIVLGVWPPIAGAAEDAAASSLDAIFAGATPVSVSDLRAMQQQIQEVSKKVIPCTVGVRVGHAHGSGVIVNKEGYVLTAAHVAGRPGERAILILHDGQQVRGETLGMHRTLDAGMVRITEMRTTNRIDWPHAPLGTSAKLAPGQWCLATGHPGGVQPGRGPILRVGRVLSIKDDASITTDCTLIGGDSGGPLFDIDGRVIGIHSRIGTPLTVNLHVPIDTYRREWDRLAAGDAWGHTPGVQPYIGVRGKRDAGTAKIAQVTPDSPAAASGIQPGDVIVKFDDVAVTDFGSLIEFVNNKQPGTRVRLQIRRGDELLRVELEIGDLRN